MKKILNLLLIVALVFTLFAFTACGDNDVTPDNSSNSENINTSSDNGIQQPADDEDLQAAYDYIKLTYKTLGTTTKSFELMKNAPIGDKVFAITWSTNNEAITITESEDGNYYVVNIPELGAAAVSYTLNFSIENDKGDKKEGSFNLTIPAFKVNTHDEYVAAEDGTALVIQGIVTGVISKTTNSTKENSLFIQDLSGNGGYYAYNLDEDPAGKISVGMTVEVRGNKKNYNGTYELVSCSATIIDSEIKPVTPVDITEMFITSTGTEDANILNLNGMLVTIKGVTLQNYNESNGYHYFKLGDYQTYLRVSSSSNCITKEEGKTVTDTFNANFYNGADVTGLIAVYNGAFYLMPVSTDAFTNFVELEKPDDVKVDTALENTKISTLIQLAGDTTLPTTFSGFSDVAIAWELISGDCATLNGATLTVTIPDAAQTVTLKATFTCGEISKSKEYAITVKPISTITIEEANNIGMNMAHNTYTDELYYIVGTIESIANSQYGNLYIVDGDFSLYVYGLYDATGKVRYDAMNPQPLPKDTIKVLSSVGKYSNDVQLKNAKVIELTIHEDNKTEDPAPEVEFKPVNPIVNTEYYFGMDRNGSIYYITGLMGTGNAQYYMATTAQLADAAKVTVIAGPTADTYYITVNVNGATKYMDLVVSGTHKNAVYVDAAPEVGFSFDATTKAFYKELEGSNYTFGTGKSGTFTTVGGVKLDAEASSMLMISFAGEHTCTFDDVVTDPTCDAEGYTTHTCACGNVVVDTPVDALGHSFNGEGVCSVCGASNHEHDYDSKVTDPTCTAAGYTTYTCKVPGCTKSYTEAGEPALGHNYTDGVCANGCGIEDPNYYYPISIEEALKAPVNKKVILTGVISGINSEWSTQYSNMEAWLSDGQGNEILLYRIKTQVGVGDKVTVQGVIGVYKEVNQIAQTGSTVTIDEKHVCSDFTEATCKKLATCKVCGAETGELAGHTYVEGVCSVCGHEEGEAEVVTSKATLKYTTATTTNMTGKNDAAKLNLDETIFSVIGNKGGTNNNCGLNKSGQIRLYGSSGTGNGSYFTVSVAEGYTIKSIKITFTSTSNNKNCQLTVGETSTTFDASSTTWEVDINADAFTLQNVIKGATTQIYIASIEITYAAE